MRHIAFVAGAGCRGEELFRRELASCNYAVVETRWDDVTRSVLQLSCDQVSDSSAAETPSGTFFGVESSETQISNSLFVLILFNVDFLSRRFDDLELRDWQDATAKLQSCYALSRFFIPVFRRECRGRIINVVSTLGLTGAADHVVESTIASSMRGFTKSLALECARNNITVNSVVCQPNPYLREIRTQAVSSSQLQDNDRWLIGRAVEIRRAIDFLCSNESGYITGSTLSVNSGHHMY